MRHARVLIVAVVLLAVGACGDDDADDADTDVSTTTTVVTTPSTTVGSTAAATTTTVVKLASPDAAAKGLYDRWKANDKTGARAYASDAAIDELFARTYTGPELEFMGCTQQGDSYDCAYRAEGGSTHFIVSASASTGWRVTDVNQVAD
jgi:hypothetical protein